MLTWFRKTFDILVNTVAWVEYQRKELVISLVILVKGRHVEKFQNSLNLPWIKFQEKKYQLIFYINIFLYNWHDWQYSLTWYNSNTCICHVCMDSPQAIKVASLIFAETENFKQHKYCHKISDNLFIKKKVIIIKQKWTKTRYVVLVLSINSGLLKLSWINTKMSFPFKHVKSCFAPQFWLLKLVLHRTYQ